MYVKSRPPRSKAQAPRSNPDRSQATRLALLDAARVLFVERGYAATGTPGVCEAAGLTRGALYHHFTDKRELFRGVIEREAQAVLAAIVEAAPPGMAPSEALSVGSVAYLDAMAVPGRTRLLLVEAPAVLGVADAMALDESHAAGALRMGLQAVAGERAGVSIEALARVLAAAFDRAALEVDVGADPAEVRTTITWLLQRTVSGLG